MHSDGVRVMVVSVVDSVVTMLTTVWCGGNDMIWTIVSCKTSINHNAVLDDGVVCGV